MRLFSVRSWNLGYYEFVNTLLNDGIGLNMLNKKSKWLIPGLGVCTLLLIGAVNTVQNSSDEGQTSADSALREGLPKDLGKPKSPDLTEGQVKVNRNADTEEKIKRFLEKEKGNISKEFPFLLHLFKDGQIAKNKAGLRISETPQSFPIMEKNPATQLSGLFFFYSLYDHGMRVPHWHGNAVELGLVLNGHMKITIWDGPGNRSVFTVEKGGVWMIPQGAVHSLENVGDEQLDFLVSYNSGYAADRDFSTAWAALPDTILERSLGLSAEDIRNFKMTTKNRLSLWDADATPTLKDVPSPYSVSMPALEPLYSNQFGSIVRVDETNWPAMKFMAMNRTRLKPGVIREPHWYTDADTLFFMNNGKAYFTLMDADGNVYNSLIEKGDLIFIPVGTFHTYVNVGMEDLEVYEAFNKSGALKEIGILDASQHFRPGTLSGATGLSVEDIQKIQKTDKHVYFLSL